MRKILLGSALALTTLGLVACGGSKTSTETATTVAESAEGGAATEAVNPDEVAVIEWAEYDALIDSIKKEADLAKRVKMMHEAEDMLMNTGALVPLYYYNDVYMLKSDVTGIYADPSAHKHLQYAKAPNNVLRAHLGSEPGKLDPALVTSNDGASLTINSFAGLFRYNENNELVPDLVDTYEVSEDGTVYTFKLLPDLKWSDGTPLTANDFVYSWNRAIDEKTAADYHYMFDVIARKDDGKLDIEASEDGQTLTVKLVVPTAYFLDLCGFSTFMPIPQFAVEAAADWETNPGSWATEAGFVSNGAFTLTEWKHDASMVYTKNPNYHRADEITLDRIELMLSSDDTALFAAFNAGNLDFIDSVPNDEIASIKGTPEFHIAPQLGTYYMSFNVKSDLFKGKTVEQAAAMRKAISMLIDREYIVENIGQTGQQPATSFVPEGIADGNGGLFKTNTADYTYPVETGYYDVAVTEEKIEEARELLRSAGFEFGDDGLLSADTPISFEYITNTTTGHIAIAEAIQQDLAAVGIDMSIKSSEWNVFLEERKAGNFVAARNGWISDFNDPINMLEMWISTSGNNDVQLGK